MQKIIIITTILTILLSLCGCNLKSGLEDLPKSTLEKESSHNQNSGMETKGNPYNEPELSNDFISDHIDEDEFNRNIKETESSMGDTKNNYKKASKKTSEAQKNVLDTYEEIENSDKTDIEAAEKDAQDKINALIKNNKVDTTTTETQNDNQQ